MSGIVIDLQDEILPMRYALSRKQLQSDDKDTALEMLTEIRDKIAQEKKPGVIKALLVGRYCTLSSAAESVAIKSTPARITAAFTNRNPLWII